MDISPRARKVVFGLIVFALVALGAYLLRPAEHSWGGTAGQQPGPATTRPPSSGPGVSSPGAADSALPGAGQPDIYQWLPFTQAGLAAAASVVTRFGDAYSTYSYTESAAAYVAPMQPLTGEQLVEQIKAAYSAPGVAAARAGGKQVSVGTATIESIRAFGPSSLTFVVQVNQRLTDTAGYSQLSTGYAVTVTGNGTTWQVSSVELVSVGNS